MILIDVETTGLEPRVHGIASIGAIIYPEGQTFYGNPRLRDGIPVTAKALEINGFSEEELRSEDRPDMASTLTDLRDWAFQAEDKILVAWNAAFDVGFLKAEFERCAMDWIFGYRSIDLHSVAHFFMSAIDEFVPAHDGFSTVGLNYTLKWASLAPEPEPHNALTGAQMNLAVYEHLLNLTRSIAPPAMVNKPDCPDCGKRMILRKPKPDGKQFDPFFGCSQYPDCRGSLDYDDGQNLQLPLVPPTD